MCKMINATFFRNEYGKIYGFKVANHGTQIVCAAVSALTINAVNGIKYLANEKVNLRSCEKCGVIEATVPKLAQGSENRDAELLLNSLLLGLMEIEKEYSKHIKITERKK